MAIVLDGTTGITTPGLTNTGTETLVNLTTTGNTILGDASTDTLNVGNGGLIKDASGNLGLGVTPSAWSGAKAFDIGSRGSLVDWSSSQQTDIWSNGYFNGSNSIYKTTNYASIYRQNNGQHIWFNASSGTAGNAITFTQAMTLDASGNLLVGGTSAGANGSNTYSKGSLLLGGGIVTAGYKYCVINYASGGSGSAVSWQKDGAEKAAMFYNESDSRLYVFNTNSTTGVYLTSGATSWTANSDERLKTDLVPIENAAQKVSTLRAVTGRFKTDDEGVSRAFLIAQDVQAVLPEAVSSGAMPMSDDTTEYLGVSYTDVIPLLVAAIKEQQALIQTLTDRITALENK